MIVTGFRLCAERDLLCFEYLSVWFIWLYVIIISRTRFRVNLHSILSWMSRNVFLGCNIWSLNDSNGIRINNHLECKGTSKHLAKLAKWLSCVLGTYLHGAFNCMLLSCTLYSCLNVKKLIPRNKRNIWSLSDNKEIQIHNNLV